MKAFRAPQNSIGPLDAEAAATLVAASSDVAIVMDGDGIIQDTAFQQPDLSLELEGSGHWVGRSWGDIVSIESQPKIDAMLRDAQANRTSPWRQVTHQTSRGRDVPILYSTVPLGGGNKIVALGRDLRAVSALQQRLVDAQMSMERDYAKLRFAETRYRLLFQSSSEPVIILDGATHRVVEANPSATALLETATKRLVGRPFGDLFNAVSRSRIQAFLADLRIVSRADDVEGALTDGAGTVMVSASLFRQEAATLLLVRMTQVAKTKTPAGQAGADSRLADFIQASPDGFVLADSAGRIVIANPTFIEMAQLGDEDHARGGALERWFGRPGVDFDVMMANLRQHGSVRLFATTLRGDQGAQLDVETSAVALGRGKTATFAFSIRDVGRRLGPAARSSHDLPRSAEQLTELIGRVPLKDLVRETTDVIEKLCIEAALELTGDNRASAAEVLGLSRQSLYVKLRRFGFADVVADDEG